MLITPHAKGIRLAIKLTPNKSLIKMLSKSCKLPASHISVATGATSRNKHLLIEGNGQELTLRLRKWIKDVTS